jgi:hypothetical protein
MNLNMLWDRTKKCLRSITIMEEVIIMIIDLFNRVNYNFILLISFNGDHQLSRDNINPHFR